MINNDKRYQFRSENLKKINLLNLYERYMQTCILYSTFLCI